MPFNTVFLGRIFFRFIGGITRQRTHERHNHIDIVFLNLSLNLCGRKLTASENCGFLNNTPALWK